MWTSQARFNILKAISLGLAVGLGSLPSSDATAAQVRIDRGDFVLGRVAARQPGESFGDPRIEATGLIPRGAVIEIPEEQRADLAGRFHLDATVEKWLGEAEAKSSASTQESLPDSYRFGDGRALFFPVRIVRMANGKPPPPNLRQTVWVQLDRIARSTNAWSEVEDADDDDDAPPAQVASVTPPSPPPPRAQAVRPPPAPQAPAPVPAPVPPAPAPVRAQPPAPVPPAPAMASAPRPPRAAADPGLAFRQADSRRLEAQTCVDCQDRQPVAAQGTTAALEQYRNVVNQALEEYGRPSLASANARAEIPRAGAWSPATENAVRENYQRHCVDAGRTNMPWSEFSRMLGSTEYPAHTMRALLFKESAGNCGVISRRGAVGAFQLLPSSVAPGVVPGCPTSSAFTETHRSPEYRQNACVQNLMNPVYGFRAAIAYLQQMRRTYVSDFRPAMPLADQLKVAAVAYLMGPRAVRDARREFLAFGARHGQMPATWDNFVPFLFRTFVDAHDAGQRVEARRSMNSAISAVNYAQAFAAPASAPATR